MRIRCIPTSLLGGVLLALARLEPAAAQQVSCTASDGFSGGCCAAATPNLPPFPAVSFADGMELCFIDCGPQSSKLDLLTLTAPAAIPGAPCGVYSAVVGGNLVAGSLKLHYSRSWLETGGGPPRRVYRFVATGDLDPVPSPIPSPCQIESSAAGQPHPFFYGFVDYVYRCANGIGTFLSAAIVVGHTCDRFQHDGSCPFSASPGSFHPLDSTVILAPGTFFSPSGNQSPPAGPAPGLPLARQAIRTLDPALCTVNDRFSSVSLANSAMQCSCLVPPLANVQPFTPQQIKGATVCGQALGPAPLCPYSPATVGALDTLYTWSIGSFGPGAYPGRAKGYKVFLTEGGIDVTNPKPPCGPSIPPSRIPVYGAETQWGLTIFTTQQRVDLVSNVDPSTQLPRVGAQGDATHVVFFY